MDITQILEVVLPIIIAVLVGWAIREGKRWLDAHLEDRQQQLILAAINMAVLATEQAGFSGGDALKNALDLINKELGRFGITLDTDRLVPLIEAEVMKQFNMATGKKPASLPDQA